MRASTSQQRSRIASLQLPGTVWIGTKPVEPVRRVETGISALDVLLGGGFPRGRLSEIAGHPSSGRTALVYALLATITRRGEVAAVVDLPDALHPEGVRKAGVDLHRLLWVRPPALKAGLKCTELILSAGGFGMVVLDLDVPDATRLPLHVWPRLARVARRADTVLAILTPRRIAGSFAATSLTLTQIRACWTPAPWRLFDGFSLRAATVRNEGRSGTSADCWARAGAE